MESLKQNLQKLRLGFVGCGYLQQQAHLPNFTSIESCIPFAIADLRPKLLAAVAEKYRIPRIYASHTELAADPEIDAVVAATSGAANAEVAIDLLNAGKHVFIEKPIAYSPEVAHQVAETARKSGKLLMVGFNKRYDAGVELAKKIIDEAIATGSMGQLSYARAYSFCGDWICAAGNVIQTDEPRPEVEPTLPEWVPQDARHEMWWINEVYSHNLNLLRYLMGNDYKVLSARMGPPTRVALLEFGGVPATFEGSRLSANHWHEETAVYFRDGYVKIRTPSALLRQHPAEVEVYRAGKVQEVCYPKAPWSWSFKREAEHFVDCVLNNTPCRSGIADSVHDVDLQAEIFRRALGLRMPEA